MLGIKLEREKIRYENIKLDLIDVGPWQARTRKIEQNTDELAENIRAVGLINPITVYQKPDKRFELVAGQRRLIAYEKLRDKYGKEWDTIPARILAEAPPDYLAKAISFSENIFRNKLVPDDVRDSIIMLYHRTGAKISTITKVLGIPRDLVVETIKYEGLPDELKKMVDEGLELDLAVRAARLAESPEGDIDVEFAKRIIPELRTLLPAQTKKLEKIKRERPEIKFEEAIEEVKAIEPTKRLVVELLMSEYEGLKKFASEKGISEREAAYRGLTTWLREEGYIS